VRHAAGLGVAFLVAAGCLAGLGAFQAADQDETVLTVLVSSAEHEAQEGYFTLGDSATLMVKPGSDLYKFFARHRGKKVRITLTEAGPTGPARLER